MNMIPLFLILALLSFFSCDKASHRERRVGVDASWTPLQFGARDENVTAFSTELLTAIGQVEKIAFVKVSVNWDELWEGLQKGKYEAVLSSMTPYIFNEKWFDFSDVYLDLGPVLVVPFDVKVGSLNELAGKEIGVVSGSSDDLMLQTIPDVIIRYYPSAPEALNAILKDDIHVAMIDVLSAISYCKDLYQEKLKVATPPLNDEGLRLITKRGQATDLIERFNRGLKTLKKDGTYEKILAKWGLNKINA